MWSIVKGYPYNRSFEMSKIHIHKFCGGCVAYSNFSKITRGRFLGCVAYSNFSKITSREILGVRGLVISAKSQLLRKARVGESFENQCKNIV